MSQDLQQYVEAQALDVPVTLIYTTCDEATLAEAISYITRNPPPIQICVTRKLLDLVDGAS